MGKAANESGLVKSIVTAIKKKYPGAYIFKVHGGPMQMAGVPDLLLCIEGLFIGAEVKFQRPGESEKHARERASAIQRVHLGKINTAGGIAGVVLSVEETLDLIDRGFIKQETVRAARLQRQQDEGE